MGREIPSRALTCVIQYIVVSYNANTHISHISHILPQT